MSACGGAVCETPIEFSYDGSPTLINNNNKNSLLVILCIIFVFLHFLRKAKYNLLIQMSTTKARTLTIENLNGLYFQFFEKFVSPNLYKKITQITELLKKPSAY